MDLGPGEKFLRFLELSENRAVKPFAHFCVQPAAPGLIKRLMGMIILAMDKHLLTFKYAEQV